MKLRYVNAVQDIEAIKALKLGGTYPIEPFEYNGLMYSYIYRWYPEEDDDPGLICIGGRGVFSNLQVDRLDRSSVFSEQDIIQYDFPIVLKGDV